MIGSEQPSFENLEDGMTVDEVFEQFPVTRE